MGQAQLAGAPYNEVTDRAEADRTDPNAPPSQPLRTGSRLLLGLMAALVTFMCLTWLAVLLGLAGWIADLIWGDPPWSFLAYTGLALAASVVIGCLHGRKA